MSNSYMRKCLLSLSGKSKSKQQWNITAQQWDWHISKWLDTTSAGVDVRGNVSLSTFDGNVWFSFSENTVWRFLKKKKLRIFLYDQQFDLASTLRSQKLFWRHLQCYVHGSNIYISQDLETTHMTKNRWLTKENVMYITNGILLRCKKRWNHAIRCFVELENIMLTAIRGRETNRECCLVCRM